MNIISRAWLFLHPGGLPAYTRTLRNAVVTVENYQEALAASQATLLMWQRIAREGWGLALDHALAHRIHCEQPEIDLREDLDGSIEALKDKLAQIEEIVV